MATEPKAKINVVADTSDAQKGINTVKQGLRDLDKVGGSALASLGDAFGVNTGKIVQMTSAIQGLGQKMTQSGNEGVKAFGALLKSITPLGGAIAGLGLAAAVAGFKALKDEADAFKQTVEGVNIQMATAAYIDTYRQAMRDFRGDFGKTLVETESGFKKFFGTIGANIGSWISSGAVMQTILPGSNPGAYTKFFGQMKAARLVSDNSEEITSQIYELERRRKEQAVDLAKLNADIADQMQIARDASVDTADRNEAIYKIELMLSQKKAMSVDLETKLAELYAKRSSLVTDSEEATDATLAQQSRQYEVNRAITQEENALLRIKNSIGTLTDAEVKKQKELTAELKKQEAALAAIHEKGATYGAALSSGLASISTPGVTAPSLGLAIKEEDVEYYTKTLQAYLGDAQISIGFKADTNNLRDISNEVNSLLESGVATSAELIGNLVGTLAGGGDAWGDFKTAAVTAFGDMAIAIGKIAVKEGIAMAGIEASLKDPSKWYLAVAAGAALIAVGYAVKSSLAAVASGDYSASGGGSTSSSYSSSSGDYETREVNVSVTGTLVADGDQLVTVISNTEKKKYYTT